jgi:hypothetical protein
MTSYNPNTTSRNERFCAYCDHDVADDLRRVELHYRHEGGGHLCLGCIVALFRQAQRRVENASPPVPWSREGAPDVWIFATELSHYGNAPHVRHLAPQLFLTEERCQNAFQMFASNFGRYIREEADDPDRHAYTELVVLPPTKYVPAKDVAADDFPVTHNEQCFYDRIVALRDDIRKAADALAADEPYTGAYLSFRNILENALERDETWAAEDAYGKEHAPFDADAANQHRQENLLAIAALMKGEAP